MLALKPVPKPVQKLVPTPAPLLVQKLLRPLLLSKLTQSFA
ncbi:hypothetical protein GCM10010833_31360 [Blastomonas aquatica]|uniref:Uncharacterized protein n=1 Tax=Blastomonas aquatica TaxID=1510276 RepID=A0ABQ1JP13_9SPHN|nr:hypothetical protein GCM10010833_31360 [Blastomonas aquatica]